MSLLFILFYNIIFYPAFFLFSTIGIAFNKKYREGFISRFYSIYILRRYFNKISPNVNIYWFHCSSRGEYLQVDTLIEKIKNHSKNNIVLVSFFSPSGYNSLLSPQVDLKIYLPFDFFWSINSALKIVNPKKIIFATTDLWPNMLTIAKIKNIETIVIGAKSNQSFGKKYSIKKLVYKYLYSKISKIFTITSTDTLHFKNIFSNDEKILITDKGNPRYDQVLLNINSIPSKLKLPVLHRNKTILFASMHREDRNIILPYILSFMQKNTEFDIIWASHEPSKSDSRYLDSIFSRYKISTGVFNSIESFGNLDSRVKVVEVVGILSKLYWLSRFAYVGGGFSTGVHNLMEPSIAKTPTIFGPNYKSFNEAIDLIKIKGGFSIVDGESFIKQFEKLLSDDNLILDASSSAERFIKKNAGATNRIINDLVD